MPNCPPPSAAASIYPHLPPAGEQLTTWGGPTRERNPLAEAMYPSLAPPQPKPSNPYREALLRGLRELNAKIDARQQREGRR